MVSEFFTKPLGLQEFIVVKKLLLDDVLSFGNGKNYGWSIRRDRAASTLQQKSYRGQNIRRDHYSAHNVITAMYGVEVYQYGIWPRVLHFLLYEMKV